MNAALTYEQLDFLPEANYQRLLSELEHYRRQSEWLSRVNELHARLAGALDLQSMMEAFSVWLMPQVDHDLIAFQCGNNTHLQMICSCHGPERRAAMSLARKFFWKFSQGKTKAHCQQENFDAHLWSLPSRQLQGHVVLLRQHNKIKAREAKLIEQALAIMAEPLKRALDYEMLFEQARSDALTGLDNRRVFEEKIGSLLDKAKRHGSPVTLASMDLDRFKLINDSFGHAEGDKTLCKVAQTLGGMVRESDLLVRMGGDEFLLVLPDTALTTARVIAERLCLAVNSLGIVAPCGAKLGISIGLVQWDEQSNVDAWLQQADEILYRAKTSGRSQVCSG